MIEIRHTIESQGMLSGCTHDLQKKVSRWQVGHIAPCGQGHAVDTDVQSCTRVTPYC